MKITIKLTRKSSNRLDRLGSDSLLGLIFVELNEKNLINDFDKIKELEIQYPQVSKNYLIQNNGPPNITLPEYIPVVLIKSILHFERKGIKVNLTTYECDEDA